MTDIKERPILFSAPMVRAILEGRKTVTRRPVKGDQIPRCISDIDGRRWIAVGQHDRRYGFVVSGSTEAECAQELATFGHCPYGKPGERLWVRETHADIGCRLTYRADTDDGAHCQVKKWTPAIHMFRSHSRILLEITAVAVERLQDITNEQAEAEGCFFTDYGRKCGHGGKGWTEVGSCMAAESTHQQREGWMWDKTTSHEQCLGSARWAFANLWEKTGGDWEGNPWVWVIEFKTVTP